MARRASPAASPHPPNEGGEVSLKDDVVAWVLAREAPFTIDEVTAATGVQSSSVYAALVPLNRELRLKRTRIALDDGRRVLAYEVVEPGAGDAPQRTGTTGGKPAKKPKSEAPRARGRKNAAELAVHGEATDVAEQAPRLGALLGVYALQMEDNGDVIVGLRNGRSRYLVRLITTSK